MPQERRDEVRQTHQLIRKFKALCRDYGCELDNDEVGGLFYQQPKAGKPGTPRRAVSANPSVGSSDSSSDDDWDRSGVEGAPMPWANLKQILDCTQTVKRVNALRGIDKAVSASREKAEAHLLELQARDEETAREAAQPLAGGDEGYDQRLLRFNAARDMPAAEAVQRCIALVPSLQRKAESILASQSDRAAFLASTASSSASLVAPPTPSASTTPAAAAPAVLQPLPEFEEEGAEASTLDEGGDEEEDESEEEGATGEVNRKLQRFTQLPMETDPAVAVVLDAQRAKIRSLAQEVDEAEREVEVQRLALDYIDKRIDGTEKRGDGQAVDPEVLNTAISLAKDLRQSKYDDELEKAKKEMDRRNAALKMTTEEEVEALENKCVAAAEHSAIVSEAAKQHMQRGDSVLSAPGIQNRGSQGDDPHELQLPVPLQQAGKEKAQLLLQQKKLKEHIDGIEKRSDELKGWLRNGEQTAKILEEIKALFLLQIAKEQPKLLGAEFNIGNQGDLTPSCEGSSDSEGSDDSDGAAARKSEVMQALNANTERLQSQLKAAEQALQEAMDGGNAQPQRLVGRAMTAKAPSAGTRHVSIVRSLTEAPEADESLTIALREAALIVRQGSERDARRRRATTVHQEQAVELAAKLTAGMAEAEAKVEDPALKAELAAMNAAEEELAEEAARRLRATRCDDLRELLRLRVKNEELGFLIEEQSAKLEQLREQRGAPVLSASPGHRLEVEGADPALVAEVTLKKRELLALRRRWWAERQDPKTVARRTHAALELGTVETEDPPMRLQFEGSCVDRIRAAVAVP